MERDRIGPLSLSPLPWHSLSGYVRWKARYPYRDLHQKKKELSFISSPTRPRDVDFILRSISCSSEINLNLTLLDGEWELNFSFTLKYVVRKSKCNNWDPLGWFLLNGRKILGREHRAPTWLLRVVEVKVASAICSENYYFKKKNDFCNTLLLLLLFVALRWFV